MRGEDVDVWLSLGVEVDWNGFPLSRHYELD